MYQQDYIMRMIRDMVRFIAKVFLNKDLVSYELNVDGRFTTTDNLHRQLLTLIAVGKINEAEDLLFKELDFKNKKHIELALDFYDRLNNLDDEFLERNNFGRDEIELGVTAIAKKLGIPIVK